MIQFHGAMHTFPKEIKILIFVFLVVLSIGFYSGLSFVNETTSGNPAGIESHYNGNENDKNATKMQFKKSKREILTLVHNHILSLSILFFLLSLILSTTDVNLRLKYFLMFEPFASVLLTFGGIYLMWNGFIWIKYVIMISGFFMTFSFVLATVLIFFQLIKKQKINI